MDERILNCQFDVHWQVIDSGRGFAVIIMTAPRVVVFAGPALKSSM